MAFRQKALRVERRNEGNLLSFNESKQLSCVLTLRVKVSPVTSKGRRAVCNAAESFSASSVERSGSSLGRNRRTYALRGNRLRNILRQIEMHRARRFVTRQVQCLPPRSRRCGHLRRDTVALVNGLNKVW